MAKIKKINKKDEKKALQILSKLKAKDIPKEKREMFKIIGPAFKAMAKQLLERYEK